MAPTTENDGKILGYLAGIAWGMFSFALLHPFWYAAVDAPHWVGPVDVVGKWGAPWWVRHSYLPVWLMFWLSTSLAAWIVWKIGRQLYRLSLPRS